MRLELVCELAAQCCKLRQVLTIILFQGQHSVLELVVRGLALLILAIALRLQPPQPCPVLIRLPPMSHFAFNPTRWLGSHAAWRMPASGSRRRARVEPRATLWRTCCERAVTERRSW